MISPSERRQLLAIANMAVGIQNSVAALLGESAGDDDDPQTEESGQVVGRRLFMQHTEGETDARPEPEASKGEKDPTPTALPRRHPRTKGR